MAKTRLTYTVTIQCPRRLAWDTLRDADGYRIWTAVFCPGSYYSGTWALGQEVRFLSPSQHGMIARVVEFTPFDVVSFEHIGMLNAGVADFTSEKVKAWTPAFETYRFADADGGTLVTVSVDTIDEYQAMMNDAFPKALAVLQALCESKVRNGGL